MFYYNQLDYAHVDYAKPDGSPATIASGGCGVCAALMVLNNLYGKEVMSVAALAHFSKDCGARGYDGTDMATLLEALSKKYAITYKATVYNKELLAHLKAGGMAVINQGTEYNVFSTSGHFVACHSVVSGDTIRCLDPYWYAGKFAGAPRCNRVEKVTGNEVWVSLSEIGKATSGRNPCYFLVSFTGKRNKPTVKAGQTVKLSKRAKLYSANSAQSAVRKISDFSRFDCAAEAVLKRGASFKADKVVTKANKNMWLYNAQYGGWICVYEYKNDISKV